MKISNYDKFEYDYSTYWKNRNYEHFAEVISLKTLLKNMRGDWFLDVGGSYGRHLPTYSNNFKHCVIVDYSLNTLINNRERIGSKFPNTHLIAANAYFLPFKKNVFDGAVMVRVLHHIQEPRLYLKELTHTLKNDAQYIQEFANKMHLKAILKHTIKGDLKFFNPLPYQQPTTGKPEGSTGEESIFLNYHPSNIKKLLHEEGFFKTKQINASFFRLPLLKRLIPFKLLIFLETISQRIFSWTNIAPSIFYKLKLKKNTEINPEIDELEDTLVCPRCKGDLIFKKEECNCPKCKTSFEKVVGIWDFRTQQ